MMPRVGTFQGRYVATKAGALIQHLLVLDDLWTSTLEEASGGGQLGEDDIEMLSELVNEMQHGLKIVPERLQGTQVMLEELDRESFARAFAAIVESSAGYQTLEPLLEVFEGQDLQGDTIAACNYLREMAGQESDLLGEKLSAIVDLSAVPPGDFRLPFRCAALLGLVGMGVVATIGLGGAPVFVGMAVVSQVGLGGFGWVGAQCPNVLPKIRFS
jgi:hypothetical protein